MFCFQDEGAFGTTATPPTSALSLPLMKIALIIVSKREANAAEELFSEYFGRLSHYISINLLTIKPSTLKEEATTILKKAAGFDLILLDESGTEFSSVQFSEFLNRKLSSSRNLCFVIGSAYGFDESLKKKAVHLISLSKMTLPHQLAKVIFIEQLYRAFTILKNEKYHH